MRLSLLILPVLLAGCATFPELDSRITPAARAEPFPALQPLGPVLAAAEGPARLTEGTQAETDARIAALRARAARLRGPVLSADERAALR